jgi:hypothetical protein
MLANSKQSVKVDSLKKEQQKLRERKGHLDNECDYQLKTLDSLLEEDGKLNNKTA